MARRGPVRSGSTRHALERSLGAMTVGVARDRADREREAAHQRLQEIEEQFQRPIQGTPGSGIVWDAIELKFQTSFVNATGQRDSPHETPQMWVGAEIQSGQPVMVTACVMEWKMVDGEEIVGATVAIGAWADASAPVIGGPATAPGAPPATPGPFRGFVHLTFQGYGAPADEEPVPL